MLAPLRLRRYEYGFTVEGGSDGLEDKEAVFSTWVDDVTDGNEELPTSFGTESAGHFAEDDTGTQRPFGSIISVVKISVDNTGKEVGANFGEALSQANATAVGRPECHDRIHPPFQTGMVIGQAHCP